MKTKTGDILIAKCDFYVGETAIILKDKKYRVLNTSINSIKTECEFRIFSGFDNVGWIWIDKFPFYTKEDLREIKLNNLLLI